MITPNDIATKTFKKVAAGYSPEEVDSFLDDIYEDYERLYADHLNPPIPAPVPVSAPVPVPPPKPIMQEIPAPPPAISQKDITAIEKALEKTLLLAEQTAVEMKEVATAEAEQTIKEAKLQAETLLQNARTTQYELEKEIADLESRYELMRTRVKLLLYAEIELLDKSDINAKKETVPEKAQAKESKSKTAKK